MGAHTNHDYMFQFEDNQTLLAVSYLLLMIEKAQKYNKSLFQSSEPGRRPPWECEAGAKLRLARGAGSLLAPAEPPVPVSLSPVPLSRAPGEPETATTPTPPPSPPTAAPVSCPRSITSTPSRPPPPVPAASAACPKSSQTAAASPEDISVSPWPESSEVGVRMKARSAGPTGLSGQCSGGISGARAAAEPGRRGVLVTTASAAPASPDRAGSLSLSLTRASPGGVLAAAGEAPDITSPVTLSRSADDRESLAAELRGSDSGFRRPLQHVTILSKQARSMVEGVVTMKGLSQQSHPFHPQPVPSHLNDVQHAKLLVKAEAVTHLFITGVIMIIWVTDSVMVNPIGARCLTATEP